MAFTCPRRVYLCSRRRRRTSTRSAGKPNSTRRTRTWPAARNGRTTAPSRWPSPTPPTRSSRRIPGSPRSPRSRPRSLTGHRQRLGGGRQPRTQRHPAIPPTGMYSSGSADADDSLRRWMAYAVHLGQSARGMVRITICRSIRRVLSRMSMPGWFSATSASVPLSSTRIWILPVVSHRAMPPL
jgi:hypothetical protein